MRSPKAIEISISNDNIKEQNIILQIEYRFKDILYLPYFITNLEIKTIMKILINDFSAV